tara:strand:+ start:1350 stop:1568 length:219 start_codon:yes stop_codon:yes gene_type:complete
MILMIIGMASIGHLVVDFLQQFEELPNKPWKCNLCLTTWLTLFPAMWVYGWEGIFVAAIAGVVSETIYQKVI